MTVPTSHKYLELPLLPIDQFVAEHPEYAEADEVALTIARIEHEHAERVELEDQRQALLKKKNSLIADNKKRKEDLANLDKELEKFIDVSEQLFFFFLLQICLWKTPFPTLIRRYDESTAGTRMITILYSKI